MKAFYTFGNISSVADEIKVKSYGTEIMTFKKSELGGDWKNLEGQEFELSPYSSADLSKLVSSGEEDHTATFPEDLKDKWYEFSRNKLHEDFFTNEDRLKEIDTTKPVEVMNKGKIISNSGQDSLAVLMGKLSKCPYLEKYLIDLSKISIVDTISSVSNDNFIKSTVKSSIYKLPSFKGLRSLLEAFKDFTNLLTTGDINFSQVTEISGAFMSSGVTYIPNLNLEKCSRATRAFYNCNKLKTVGNVYVPELQSTNKLNDNFYF